MIMAVVETTVIVVSVVAVAVFGLAASVEVVIVAGVLIRS